jgi:hypothetical protein
MTIKQLWKALLRWLGRSVNVVDKLTEAAEYGADIVLETSKSWHDEFSADFAETQALSKLRKENAEAKAKADLEKAKAAEDPEKSKDETA